jgi:hypothetical protein
MLKDIKNLIIGLFTTGFTFVCIAYIPYFAGVFHDETVEDWQTPLQFVDIWVTGAIFIMALTAIFYVLVAVGQFMYDKYKKDGE